MDKMRDLVSLQNLYLSYWRRGWWCWLLMFLVNLICALICIPFAFLFKGNKPFYYFSICMIGLIFIAPIVGWLFEKFARSSSPINTQEPEI